MIFSFKNIVKVIIVTLVFTTFLWLFIHLYDLENTNYLKNNLESIPVIEADTKPYKILPEEKNNTSDPFIDSCTLNYEC